MVTKLREKHAYDQICLQVQVMLISLMINTCSTFQNMESNLLYQDNALFISHNSHFQAIQLIPRNESPSIPKNLITH